jgi:isoaspartyl peptidase/L-asparaginase-like protein (Ntn-hydrolase superfamily)
MSADGSGTGEAGSGDQGPMTLLLTVSAVERLRDPVAAVTDAKTWSEHVGIVGDDVEPVEAVRQFVDDLEADPDLVAGPTSGSLADIRQRLRTERHVLVGTDERHASIAAALGWEYLDVEDAAAKADWRLTGAPVTGNDT